ncbi:MAG TPA: hypothetical protein VFF67_03160 [Thermoplasmata archaeon]|nr:hypothetical protein [Thermoplasmata archaeon]
MPGNGESAAYLGGIGMMVSQSDVCPSCGKTHQARRFGLRVVRDGSCPVVVMGTFPTVAANEEGLEAPEVAPESIRLEIPRGISRRTSVVSSAWLAPPLTEEYL